MAEQEEVVHAPAPEGDAGSPLCRPGAEAFDPVRFRFIAHLAQQAQAHEGKARAVLIEKLEKAQREFDERFEQARKEAEARLAQAAAQFPEDAEALQRLFSTGDFAGLRHFITSLERRNQPTPLAELAESLARHASAGLSGDTVTVPETPAAPERELKSLRYFRDTWSKLSVEQQLAQALAQGPENAGPLNSHLLVLRSLELMRQHSPEYLNRFMAYVDALLWLEQADNAALPARKTAPSPRAA